MNCKKCGFELDSKDTFCPRCGEKVQKEDKSIKFPVAVYGFILILVIVVVVGFLNYYNDKGNAAKEGASPGVQGENTEISEDKVETTPAVELDRPTVKDGVLTPREFYAGVYFEWDKIEGADGYEVRIESKPYSADSYGNPELEEITDNNYEAGAQDYFDFRIRVRAFAETEKGREYGGWSAYASGSSYEPSEVAEAERINKEYENEGQMLSDDSTEKEIIKADEYYHLSKEHDQYEILEEYTIPLMENGKYRNYEGNLGNIIDCYRDKDLNGDGETDKIERIKGEGDYGAGYYYKISFSDGTTIQTKVFSNLPNEGETIEYKDINGDGVSEILFTHYTDSTGGSIAWDVYLYYLDKSGQWSYLTLVDENDRFTEIADACGFKALNEGGPKPVGVEIVDDGIAILLDHGYKNGPDQGVDFDVVTLSLDNGWLTVTGHSKDLVSKYWPMLED